MLILTVWGACTAVSFAILRLGAQDTPANVWAPAAPSWSEHLTFWDSGWYARIHREGYPVVLPVGLNGTVAQNSWAFMPLLPMLAGLLTWTGWSFYVCAALVAIAASAGAALAMDRWLSPRVGPTASAWAVALVWSSPCAAILQVPYAESLGLLLTALVLWQAGRHRFLMCVPLVALAAFSRPIGVPLAAALGLWWAWEAACARGVLPESWTSALLPGTRRLTAAQRLHLLILTLLACLSALAWPAIAWAATGRADAYTATETSWRSGSLAPFVPWLIRGQWWVGAHLSLILVAMVLVLTALMLSAPALRRLGPAPWFWCLAYILYLLAFFDPTSSLLRLLLPLAPAAWAAADCVRGLRGRLALAAGGVIGQLFWVSWVWDASIAINWVP